MQFCDRICKLFRNFYNDKLKKFNVIYNSIYNACELTLNKKKKQLKRHCTKLSIKKWSDIDFHLITIITSVYKVILYVMFIKWRLKCVSCTFLIKFTYSKYYYSK